MPLPLHSRLPKEVMIMAKEKAVCEGGICLKCKGAKLLVVGILVLLNTYYGWMSWAYFVGWILVLVGVLKLICPTCPHCK